jgi:hypothetical protein
MDGSLKKGVLVATIFFKYNKALTVLAEWVGIN